MLMAMGAAIMAIGPAAGLEGETFGLTEVNFADGTITITNNGDADVDPNGLIVCNFPDYAPVAGAPTALGPGESTVVDLASIGIPANASSGEMGLYLTSEFTDPNALVSYVEWGSAGHTRASVAMAAGIWDGAAVDVGDGSAITTTSDSPTAGADWAASGGGQLPQTGVEASTVGFVALALIVMGAGLLLRTESINPR